MTLITFKLSKLELKNAQNYIGIIKITSGIILLEELMICLVTSY